MRRRLHELAPGVAWVHRHRGLTMDALASCYALPPRAVAQLLDVPGHEVGPLVGIVNGEDLRA